MISVHNINCMRVIHLVTCRSRLTAHANIIFALRPFVRKLHHNDIPHTFWRLYLKKIRGSNVLKDLLQCNIVATIALTILVIDPIVAKRHVYYFERIRVTICTEVNMLTRLYMTLGNQMRAYGTYKRTYNRYHIIFVRREMNCTYNYIPLIFDVCNIMIIVLHVLCLLYNS